jgi:hypothetical protein
MGIKAVVTQPNHRVVGWLWCPHLIPCQVGVVNVMWYPCGRSWMCIARMNLWDLSHTCACTWCRIQTKWWKQNNSFAGFKNQGALKIIQTKFYSHHETYFGDPRATSRKGKSKSRTYLEVLTMTFCWWMTQSCCHGNSSIFKFIFILWCKMKEPTPFPNQDN